jgi:hypothetical protein
MSLSYDAKGNSQLSTNRLILYPICIHLLLQTHEKWSIVEIYQTDDDDNNIKYLSFLCSSFYQNFLKKSFDVFSLLHSLLCPLQFISCPSVLAVHYHNK